MRSLRLASFPALLLSLLPADISIPHANRPAAPPPKPATAARAHISVPGPSRKLVPIVASVMVNFRHYTLEVRANGDVLLDGTVLAHLTPDAITFPDGRMFAIAPDGRVTQSLARREWGKIPLNWLAHDWVGRVQPDGTVDGTDGTVDFAIHGATANFNGEKNCVANQVARTDHLPPEAYWTAGLLVLCNWLSGWDQWKNFDSTTPVVSCNNVALIELHATGPTH